MFLVVSRIESTVLFNEIDIDREGVMTLAIDKAIRVSRGSR